MMTKPRTTTRRWSVNDRLRLLLISVLALALVALTVALGAQVLGALVARTPAARAIEPVALADLTPGSCVLTFIWRATVLPEYTVTSCEGPHGAELIAKIDGSEAFETYPGRNIAIDFATEACDAVERYAVNLRDELQEEYPSAVIREVYPSPYTWGIGSPYVYCFLTNADGKRLEGRFYTDDTFE